MQDISASEVVNGGSLIVDGHDEAGVYSDWEGFGNLVSANEVGPKKVVGAMKLVCLTHNLFLVSLIIVNETYQIFLITKIIF